MKIFVSWSGPTAGNLALFMQTWLRQVIQELEPFMSQSSIEKGTRWSKALSAHLGDTSQAIVCVTRDNQAADWLNFEAGALAKLPESRVRTLLVDILPSDVTGPLSEFQHTIASNKEDVCALIESINAHCDRPLSPGILASVFEREWPAFENKIAEVIELGTQYEKEVTPTRTDSDLLSEILERVRAMERIGTEQSSLTNQLLNQISISDLIAGRSLDSFLQFERLGGHLAEREREYQVLSSMTSLVAGQQVARNNSVDPFGTAMDIVKRGEKLYVRVTLPDGSKDVLEIGDVRLVN
ncbi:hypothetical protein AB0C34_18785 [Nocardia sp. NPDC049220]|uniref:hypothetical protein n=1 Tax=Nocardia sp. NPDC049220 TaxID=3155273 RepID=UPI0033D33732